jgi:hypothetical protein
MESIGDFDFVHESGLGVLESLSTQDVHERGEHVTTGVVFVVVSTLHAERVRGCSSFGFLVESLSGQSGEITEIGEGLNGFSFGGSFAG